MTSPPQGNYAGPETVKSSRGQFVGGIEDVVTDEWLLYAFSKASSGKRFRSSVFNYTDNLGENLSKLKQCLLDGSYKPRPCSTFEIFCTAGQKIRTISAPAFEDTIVQHLLYQRFYDLFDRGFIFDSYGCRRGKGTHRASDRLQHFMRKAGPFAYTLQLDIRKYYYRIVHSILRESIERRIKDKRLADLFMAFAGDSTVGLNVGSLLSQLFGAIYLDRFDHFVKRILKVRYYVRYVDDMVLILPSRKVAEETLRVCEDYLRDNLRLELSKWRIAPVRCGVNFVGFRTWPTHRLIRKRSLHSFGKRLKERRAESLASILGHALHTSSYRHLLGRVVDALPLEDFSCLPSRYRQDARRYVN